MDLLCFVVNWLVLCTHAMTPLGMYDRGKKGLDEPLCCLSILYNIQMNVVSPEES